MSFAETCQQQGDATSLTCGWIAVIISTMAFGSFAVPIKSPTCVQLNIDPLVFQSYKTFLCLTTSTVFVYLFLDDTYFTFSPWGIVSGLFWVPSGIAAVYAVQHAGLAVSQGVWSSFIVLVSFTWGLGIFRESVKSLFWTVLWIWAMITGLWGMSFFSSPLDITSISAPSTTSSNRLSYVELSTASSEPNIIKSSNDKDNGLQNTIAVSSSTFSPSSKNDFENSCMHAAVEPNNQTANNVKNLSDRTKGLLAATFNGLWGGSVMVPMHYSTHEGGFHYIMSFAIGASIITLLLWFLRFGYNFVKLMLMMDSKSSDPDLESAASMPSISATTPPSRSLYFTIQKAYQDLPSFYIRQMILPGGIAGFLWSIGNIASMISVSSLGEGIGYSVIQASMLVSGLWGIFWFQEIQGYGKKIKWFASATCTVIGIIGLSYQHV